MTIEKCLLERDISDSFGFAERVIPGFSSIISQYCLVIYRYVIPKGTGVKQRKKIIMASQPVKILPVDSL